MQVLLLELFPAEVVRIVRAYAVCQKCCNDVKGNYNLCTRCLYFDRCLGELFSVFFAPIFFFSGTKKIEHTYSLQTAKTEKGDIEITVRIIRNFLLQATPSFSFFEHGMLPNRADAVSQRKIRV